MSGMGKWCPSGDAVSKGPALCPQVEHARRLVRLVSSGKSRRRPMQLRTIPQAIEDAAKAEPTRGYRFVPETGVPGVGGLTDPSAPARVDGRGEGEASFSFTAVERISARFGGAMQALGLRK